MTDEDDAVSALVVDDDHRVLTLALEILEEAGFQTLMALNAEEAIAALEQHAENVTLLFTDVEMPGAMDGFGLAREVAVRWPDIGILVASGNRPPHDGDMPDGAVFVGKPFSAEVVHGHVHELLPTGKKPNSLVRRMSASL